MVQNTCDVDDDDLHLPQDVLIQILVFLPVISLLRFKSVCKSWCALIQSSFFIDLHLNNNNNNHHHHNNFGTFIFQTNKYSTGKQYCEAFMLSSGGGGGGGGGEKLKWEDLGFPPCYRVHENTGRIHMVGSCNGLICIDDPQHRDVSLWNPATRQFRLLPKSLTTLAAGIGGGDLDGEDFAAFGYDVKTKDYKVVQISCFKPHGRSGGDIHVSEFIFRVQVYSLGTDSWRLLDGINSFPGFPGQGGAYMNHGVYRNGIYYFLAGYIGSKMILSFDFTKEIFSTIQLPLDYYYDYSIVPDLTYLGEKLALFAKVLSKEDHKSDFDDYDIWVLKNHEHSGKEESWTKIHSFQLSNVCTRKIPKIISNDGEFALIATRVNGRPEINVLQLINLVAKEVVKMEFRTDHWVTRADVYKQSLVSIGVQHPELEILKSLEFAEVHLGNNLEISAAIITAPESIESHSATHLEVSPMLDTSPMTSDNQADTINSPKYCFFYIHSETSYETCGPRRDITDVPQLVIVRYTRNSTKSETKVEKKRKTIWDTFQEEDENLAAQLVARYNGSLDIPEIIQWVSQIVKDGDSTDLPFFRAKTPELIPEDSNQIWSSGTQKVYSTSRGLIQTIQKFITNMYDRIGDPRLGPMLLLGAVISFGSILLQKSRASSSNQPSQSSQPSQTSQPIGEESEKPKARRRTRAKKASGKDRAPSITDDVPKDAYQIIPTDSDSD